MSTIFVIERAPQGGAPYIWGYGQSVAEDWINPGLDKVKINIGYLDFIHT